MYPKHRFLLCCVLGSLSKLHPLAFLSSVCLKSPHKLVGMSHNHDNGHNCGDHAHDHDHTQNHNSGPSDNVFVHIDRDNVIALNSTGEGKLVIKPWDERLDEQVVGICA